ncbi:hypothetical protein WH50_22405, partial [Pokkaliibacter plantistimulans]
AVAVAVALTLASTLPVFSYSAEASKDNDTLVFASDSEPEHISPYHTGLREGIVLGRLAWDTLTYRGPRRGQYQPMLATDWSREDSTHLQCNDHYIADCPILNMPSAR